jgi:hypothetical protein
MQYFKDIILYYALNTTETEGYDSPLICPNIKITDLEGIKLTSTDSNGKPLPGAVLDFSDPRLENFNYNIVADMRIRLASDG